MKKITLALALLGVALIAEAQTTSLTARIAWTPNPVTENITSYIVTLDGVKVTAPQTCTATECSVPITITTLGSHTATVTAVNDWGQGQAGTGTANVIVPGKAVNIIIKK